MYVINAILVLMVIRQLREHSLDLRALAVPVLAVAAAAVMFLHSVPVGGSDIALELLGVMAGAAMGAIGGLATRLRRGADGRPLGRAGALAAGMWVAGVGARMAFAFAATHGAGPAIGRFSLAHHITGSGAWVAALVMMALADVLTRLAVVWLRGRRLAAAPAAARALTRPDLVPGPPQPDRACEARWLRRAFSLAPRSPGRLSLPRPTGPGPAVLGAWRSRKLVNW